MNGKGGGACSPGTFSASGHLRGILYPGASCPSDSDSVGQTWGPGDSDKHDWEAVSFEEILVKARGQDQNRVLTLEPG